MEPDRVLLFLKLMVELDTGALQSDLLNSVVRMVKEAQLRVCHSYCVVCRVAQVRQGDPILQEHHVAGKVRGQPNFNDTMTVCSSCHEPLCDRQKSWQPTEHGHELPSWFYGWADVFDLLYEKSNTEFFACLARKLRFKGWDMRNAYHSR
jgi:hypothetical protein